MNTTIIRHIPGKDIPPEWAAQIKDNLNQSFTLIIRPDEKADDDLIKTSVAERRRVFDLLEGTSGEESSEEWIGLLKNSRTTSPLKPISGDEYGLSA